MKATACGIELMPRTTTKDPLYESVRRDEEEEMIEGSSITANGHMKDESHCWQQSKTMAVIVTMALVLVIMVVLGVLAIMQERQEYGYVVRPLRPQRNATTWPASDGLVVAMEPKVGTFFYRGIVGRSATMTVDVVTTIVTTLCTGEFIRMKLQARMGSAFVFVSNLILPGMVHPFVYGTSPLMIRVL